MMDELYRSHKPLADLALEHAESRKLADAAKQPVDAQTKHICEGYVHMLDVLRSSFRAHKSELLQEDDKWLVK